MFCKVDSISDVQQSTLKQLVPIDGSWYVLENGESNKLFSGKEKEVFQIVIDHENHGHVHIPTNLKSFALRSTTPTIVIQSKLNLEDKETSLIGLALVARGCFFSNFKAFETMESLAEKLVKNEGVIEMMEAFHGTDYPIQSPFINALVTSTNLPYSSCIALGSVKEAEIARALKKCDPALVGRLSRLFKSLNLPSKFDRKKIDTTAVRLALKKIISGETTSQISCILPNGLFHLSSTERFSFRIAERVISDALQVVPFNQFHLESSVRVPGSKSVSNRALLLAGLSSGSCIVRGLLHSDDTEVMMGALEQLGSQFTWIQDGLLVKGNGGKFSTPTKPLWMGNAGTATRFVISLCCLVQEPESQTTMIGSHRMMERPQGDLIDALIANGCTIKCSEKPGHLPLVVKGGGFPGGKMTLSGKISSQYVSSVLFAAPYANEPLELTLLEAEPTSISYIEMTVATMAEFGVHVERLAVNKFRVPNTTGYIAPSEYFVEADASSATYALACASVVPSRRVTVLGVGSQSLQGDAEFCRLLEKMGSKVEQTKDSTTVTGPTKLVPPHVPDSSIDMANLTDAFLTAVACAAVTDGVTKITGIANQHVKECDRIAALVKELGKLGISCDNLPDGILIRGRGPNFSPEDRDIYLDTYDDHRVAMSLAVLGSRVPHLVITDKDCTDKTYPDFWDDFENHLNTQVNAFPTQIKTWTNQTLVLIGMRGAGKTTMGKLCASHLGWNFVDMDDFLLKQSKFDSCKQIVEKLGWEKFREMEYQALLEALKSYPEKYVISCGGGVVEYAESREILKSYYPVLNLERSFDDIEEYLGGGVKRSRTDDGKEDVNRPLFDEPLINVWNRRRPYFTQCSNFDFYIPSQQGKNEWEFIMKDFVHFIDNLRQVTTPASFMNDSSLSRVVNFDDFQEPFALVVKEVLGEIRQEMKGKFLIVKSSSIDILKQAGRCGCEGMEILKLNANETSQVLSNIGPIRLKGVHEKVLTQYPNKAMSTSLHEEMYYLFGSPIQLSPSPTLHNTAFRFLKQDNRKRYEIFDTKDIDLVNYMIHTSKNFQGASITIPHKQGIVDLNHLSNEAKRIGAINTVVKTQEGNLVGDNTDWIGIKNCIQLHTKKKGSHVLVVGAGGTARAACYCVEALGLKLYIYNRTEEKAVELSKEFGGEVVKFDSNLTELVAIISTVPASSKWEANPIWLKSKPIVLDVAYRPRRTALLEQAKIEGCETAEGIDMLLEQGYEQVKRFQARSIDKKILEHITVNAELKQHIKQAVLMFYES